MTRYLFVWLLLADYNILQGRVWSLFLVWILVLPVLVFSAGRSPG